MPSAFLNDRGAVRVSGDDACDFLQGLVTCDMAKVAPGRSAYGALLTPQGKIIADFIVHEAEGAYWLDCPLALAPDLAKRLRFYKLRARVEAADVSNETGVAVVWGSDGVLGETDPRNADLGRRIVGDRAALAGAHSMDAAPYHAHRISLGAPQGGDDFIYGDTFPHEANLDKLNGVDFRKGCYVGQEVVSRVEHRRTARKRIVKVELHGGRPEIGAPVYAGGIEIGRMGSSSGDNGLALLRLDRIAEARSQGAPITCGGVEIFPVAQEAEPAR